MCPASEQRLPQANIDSSANRTRYSLYEWSATRSGLFTPSEEIYIFCRNRRLPQACSEHGAQRSVLVSLLDIESGPTIAELESAMSSSSFPLPVCHLPSLPLSLLIFLLLPLSASYRFLLSSSTSIIIIMNCIILHFIYFCTNFPNC